MKDTDEDTDRVTINNIEDGNSTDASYAASGDEQMEEDGSESGSDSTSSSDDETDKVATKGEAKPSEDKHSPSFLVTDLITPFFRTEMKKRGITASSSILPSGKFNVTCRYEDREIVGTGNIDSSSNNNGHQQLRISIRLLRGTMGTSIGNLRGPTCRENRIGQSIRSR